jgi:hypothetical protein
VIGLKGSLWRHESRSLILILDQKHPLCILKLHSFKFNFKIIYLPISKPLNRLLRCWYLYNITQFFNTWDISNQTSLIDVWCKHLLCHWSYAYMRILNCTFPRNVWTYLLRDLKCLQRFLWRLKLVCNVTLCRLIKCYQHFGGPYCLHL